MEELLITTEELDYLTHVPNEVCEPQAKYGRQMNFEEEAKDCITLEEFSKLWEESINRLIPNL